jgi:hypothetical protein
MAEDCCRGHRIVWDGNLWRYADDGTPAEDWGGMARPCVRCGQMPTPEGHDACLGTLPNVSAACCGHGVREPYIKKMTPEQRRRARLQRALSEAERRLAETRRENYSRETDYKKVMTARTNRVNLIRKEMEG